jgi:hypothetical protein
LFTSLIFSPPRDVGIGGDLGIGGDVGRVFNLGKNTVVWRGFVGDIPGLSPPNPAK